jgi:hypothetical protein
MPGLNWTAIALMATAAPAVGFLVAGVVWKLGQIGLGNLAGTVVIFSEATLLIVRESVELQRLAQRCLDAGWVCWPVPAAFTRYAIYASIGLVEVFALFMVSLKVEERIRRRDYAPEWR